MHELSLVSDLVDECCRRAGGEAVSLARVRCSMPDLHEELQQAFVMMSTSTLLEGAVLEVESVAVRLSCPCGYQGPTDGGGTDHLFVCPECSKVRPITAAGLELLEVRRSS
jgi:Zn finger protein HypA/HybF involved in hydrogenase expression